MRHCYTQKMASLFRRSKSPFWWLRYRPEGGKWRSDSTGLRVDSEEETCQAEVIRATWALRESENRGKEVSGYDWGWVDVWLEGHCKSPKTLAAYRLHWRHIQHWMRVTGIRRPQDVTFRHGQLYVAWRTGRRAGRKLCGKNTALLEVKFLGQVLRQAALRGEIAINPIQRLGISRDEIAEKRELTDDEIARCVAALTDEEEWLRLSFLIGLHTGLRLSETRLRMNLVDFDRMIITVESPKGGKRKAFSRPLPAALVEVLEPLRSREFSHEFPFQPSRQFQHFFQRLEVSGVSFHSLRVTYVTRLHRAGVPLSAAMRLVNHSSQLVHRIYTKLAVDDVRAFADVPLFATSQRNLMAGQTAPRAETPSTDSTV